MSLTFIGQPDGAHIKAAVMFHNEIVSIDGPLWFTLDQWHRLKELGEEVEDDSPIWATTVEEYEFSTGDHVTP